MKTLTTLTAVAALIAGMSIANAQNTGGQAGPGGSAMQSGGMKDKRATGNGKFCIETTKGGGLDCKFADLATCTKEAQPRNVQCSPNPNSGTTGSR